MSDRSNCFGSRSVPCVKAWEPRSRQPSNVYFFFCLSLTATGHSDPGAERRLQDIVSRRKLVDLAKAQAQEVAVLRAEVERLRMRTFPALVQIEH